MIKKRQIDGIYGILLLGSILYYMVFGYPKDRLWSFINYINIDLIVIWICGQGLRVRDLLPNVIIQILRLIFSIWLIFDIYGLLNQVLADKVNNSYYTGGIIAIIVLIFLIYKYGRIIKG